MDLLEKTATLLEQITKHITALLVLGMSVIVLAQVWTRYVTHSPLPWSEEAARYLMIWLAFLAASRAFRQDRHIGMNIFINALPGKIKKWAWFFSRLLLAGILGFIIYESYLLLPGVQPELTPALRISLMWPYLAITMGMSLFLVQVLIKAATGLMTE